MSAFELAQDSGVQRACLRVIRCMQMPVMLSAGRTASSTACRVPLLYNGWHTLAAAAVRDSKEEPKRLFHLHLPQPSPLFRVLCSTCIGTRQSAAAEAWLYVMCRHLRATDLQMRSCSISCRTSTPTAALLWPCSGSTPWLQSTVAHPSPAAHLQSRRSIRIRMLA